MSVVLLSSRRASKRATYTLSVLRDTSLLPPPLPSPAASPHVASTCTTCPLLLALSSSSLHCLRRVRWAPPSLSLCLANVHCFGWWLGTCALPSIAFFNLLSYLITAALSVLVFIFLLLTLPQIYGLSLAFVLLPPLVVALL
jgi:hypothetical protein